MMMITENVPKWMGDGIHGAFNGDRTQNQQHKKVKLQGLSLLSKNNY